MIQFDFATANRIIFGNGTSAQIGSIAKEFGQRAMVVTWDLSHPLFDRLGREGLELIPFFVSGEPTIELAEEAIERAREKRCELVIGIGGGSVIDTGKVVAAMLSNTGELLDYLEVIGRGKQLERRAVPYLAVPTTAGTGAEATRNAVLKSEQNGVKVSIRSAFMLPACAIVDPELTYSMPPSVTASTGLDALTQLMEAYVTKKANPLTDGLCREGIRRAARSLLRAFQNGHDAEPRADMSIASLFSGIALANAGLGAVHGFAAPLGGMFPAPHGVICARILPFVMETNIRALVRRQSNSPSLVRYKELAEIITGRPDANAEDGLTWIKDLCDQLQIPPLKRFGLAQKDIPKVVQKAKQASSMKGNPIELTDEELTEILEKAIGE
ncbi:MAG: iron-containing alcohol dehydrogenase [candidate division KSB1 bacterium]|nr:iron-containing alcohol dehydrogenase [candidate division KSB1 bacterium]MDZ7358012.1 iron-containing alcohol dehydrogenase [candidate division KSB1 bacterium]MDZ7399413.1 iron-containing alcohol dehydrogenase [candidate division KSB1 bacterium]